MAPDPVWRYPRAIALSNYDGDTVTLQIDVGLSTYRRVTVRLARINTPEMKEAGGPAAKARTRELVAIAPLEVVTIKDKTEKYGRYLAEIINAEGINVADQLIEEGFGKPYDGGKR